MMSNIFSRIFKRKRPNESSVLTVEAKTLVNDEINVARELLKEATQLKREKKYEEACDKLKEAYSAKGSENIMIEERLRLPMYLQLSGKNDDGWRILNELNVTHVDVFSQLKIADQMRIFLQKEKKNEHAILFGAWVICKRVEAARFNIASSISMSDEMSQFDSEINIPELSKERREIYGYTEKGRPISDPTYKMFCDQIENDISLEGVKEHLLPLLKKAKLEARLDGMSSDLSDYLNSRTKYDLAEVRDIVFSEKK